MGSSKQLDTSIIYIDTSQRESASDAKKYIKPVTVHGHYSGPLSYRQNRFNHYMRHTKNITKQTMKDKKIQISHPGDI